MLPRINGRTLVTRGSGAQITTQDPCWVQGSPVVCQNIAYSTSAMRTVNTVKVNGFPACNESSQFYKSVGSAGAGVITGTMNGRASVVGLCSPNTFIGGKRALLQGSLMQSNAGNTSIAAIQQSGGEAARAKASEAQAIEDEKSSAYRLDLDVVTSDLDGLVGEFILETPTARVSMGLGHGVQQKQRLQLAIPARSQKITRLGLMIPTEDGDPITLPLLNNVTARRVEDPRSVPDRIKNLWVAVEFRWRSARQHASIENDPCLARLPYLRSPGWVYIFIDGHLWRECHVCPESFVKDVDLQRQYGQDERKATGLAHDRILVPYKQNGHRSALEIAYSEVQWSWARVNYFGGVDPHDPRFVERKLTMRRNPKGKRSDRFDTIDFSGDPASSERFKIVLNDPLGMVGRIESALAREWDDYLSCLKTISQKPFFHSAVAALQIFFNKKHAHRKAKINSNPRYQFIVYTPNAEMKASQYIDRERIDQLLETKKRQKFHQVIRALQQDLIDALNNINPTGTSFNMAITDYFAAAGARYQSAFIIMNGLLSHVLTDPGVFDQHLSVSPETIPVTQQPGPHYILQLLQTDHPLHFLFFPPDGSIDVTRSHLTLRTAGNTPLYIPLSENDGSGRFRPKTFMVIHRAILNGQETVKTEVVPEYDDEDTMTYGHMEHAVTTIMQRLVLASHHYITELLAAFRVAGRVARSEFQDLPIIASVKFARATGCYDRLHTQRLQKALTDDHSYVPGISDLKDPKKIPTAVSKKTLSAVFHIRTAQLAHNITHGLFRGTKAERLATLGLLGLNKTLAGSVFVFGLSNLSVLSEQWMQQQLSTPRLGVEMTMAITGLALSLKALSGALLGEPLAEHLIRRQQWLARVSVDHTITPFVRMLGTPLELFGVFMGGFGVVLSLWDGLQGLYDLDLTTASGNGMIAVGASVQVMSQVGKHILARMVSTGGSVTVLEEVLTFFGPFGWVGMAILVLGVLWVSAYGDDQLMRWAKHGPFSRIARLRLQGRYADWEKPQGDRLACQSLLSPFMSPTIRIEASPYVKENEIMIVLELPRFVDGGDQIDLQANWEYCIVGLTPVNVASWITKRRAQPYKIVEERAYVDRHGKYMEPEDARNAEGSTLLTIMQYFYRDIPRDSVQSTFSVIHRLNARVRLITQENLIFPSGEFPGTKKRTAFAKPTLCLPMNEPGWAYPPETYTV